MMHSQRQKRRHSQFKKKRYDEKAGKESDERLKTKENTKRTEDLHTEVNDVEPVITDKGYENKQKYSKRKVDSNWEKYSEIKDEPHYMMDEEALEQRLAQLLLIQPSNRLPINQPLPVPSSIDIPEDKQDKSGPKLDLAALATTLSTLSLHERLLIDENIIHVCEREYDCTVLRETDSLRVESEEQCTQLSGINLDFKTKPAKITKETSNHTSQSIRHDSDKRKIVLDQELENLLQLSCDQDTPVRNVIYKEKRDYHPKVEQDPTANSELDAMLDELLD